MDAITDFQIRLAWLAIGKGQDVAANWDWLRKHDEHAPMDFDDGQSEPEPEPVES